MTTNGLVSAQQAYPTAQRLLGCGVRAATVALNSADPKQYAALMRPEPSGCGHADVCTFITLCAEVGVQVCAGLPASSSPSLPLVGTGADASERCKAVVFDDATAVRTRPLRCPPCCPTYHPLRAHPAITTASQRARRRMAFEP